MSNIEYPQVLMPKLMHRIPMMFSMKPALTYRRRRLSTDQNTFQKMHFTVSYLSFGKCPNRNIEESKDTVNLV